VTTGLAVGIDVSAVPGDPRGAGRYVIELVRALAARDVVDLHLQARRRDADRWRSAATAADVRAVVPGSRPARLIWEQVASPRFVDRWGIAVHHGPHYTMPERAKVPKVVTIHDLTFFDHPEWHEKVKVAVFTRAIRSAAALADGIVCVSEPTARRLRELLDPQCPVHVVRHGIDHELFRPEPDGNDAGVLARYGIRPPYVGFVGTLEPRKDLGTLVRAFDEIALDHADLQLVIAGGQGWGNAVLDAAMAATPHRDRIVTTGYVPDEVVPALLRSAAAVVYAALEEGFGLPAIEALACGAPLVTTTGSVMAELADGAATLVPAGDVGGLAAALMALVQAPDDARRRHGLDVAARFTWDASAAGHEAIYAAVAEAGPRRR
jgi:glycosyltransferase involved in cell wall biosynthesis